MRGFFGEYEALSVEQKKQLVRNEETLLDFWIISKFNVLPTEERFKQLHYATKELLYIAYNELPTPERLREHIQYLKEVEKTTIKGKEKNILEKLGFPVEEINAELRGDYSHLENKKGKKINIDQILEERHKNRGMRGEAPKLGQDTIDLDKLAEMLTARDEYIRQSKKTPAETYKNLDTFDEEIDLDSLPTVPPAPKEDERRVEGQKLRKLLEHEYKAR